MRRFCVLVLLPLVVFVFAGVGGAQSAEAKYGVVDIQRVLRVSKGGRAANASLTKDQKKLEGSVRKKRDALAAMAKKIRALQAEIEKKGSVWQPAEKERKTFDLRSRRRDFAREQDNLKRLVDESRRDLRERQRVALEKVLKEVRGIVDEIAKTEGLNIVVDSATGGVLFASPKVDMTDRVIKMYDAKKK